MLVVADTSPFIGLVKIGLIDVLPRLYKSVIIPPEVAAELAGVNRPTAVREFIAGGPAWLTVRAPAKVELIPDIHVGECAAISLAVELTADLLLIDDNKGREAAISRNVRTARTAAVLFDAAVAGVIPDLREAYDRLRATNFRVPVKALDALLEAYDARRGQSP